MIEVTIKGVEGRGLRVALAAVPQMGQSIWIDKGVYRVSDVRLMLHQHRTTKDLKLEDIVVEVCRVC